MENSLSLVGWIVLGLLVAVGLVWVVVYLSARAWYGGKMTALKKIFKEKGQ